ncbi:hypothetical protein RISK_001704 [Rhodopirellula islandica]|uniref:Uncharacterized protein n=1 Tax=Rhodopirellula islandica TaxID=595434 RepID=A0A0J1BJ91_RHOIS|nr:hypothetical protein RISK_001704 [Rhodopirellula islandica]
MADVRLATAASPQAIAVVVTPRVATVPAAMARAVAMAVADCWAKLAAG